MGWNERWTFGRPFGPCLQANLQRRFRDGRPAGSRTWNFNRFRTPKQVRRVCRKRLPRLVQPYHNLAMSRFARIKNWPECLKHMDTAKLEVELRYWKYRIATRGHPAARKGA